MTSADALASPAEGAVPLGMRVAYGLGQVCESIKTYAFSLFVLYYYNQVLGLPGSATGLAIGIALVFDAVTDPLAGSISDNWRSRWGRRHPFMLASALPLGLCFAALFMPPAGLEPSGLLIWLTVFAIATRTALTLYHVPHQALGAELSSDYAARTGIVAYRLAFGYLGVVLMAALGFGVFFSDARGGQDNVEAYVPFGLTMAAIMIATALVSVWGTWRSIPSLPPAATRRVESAFAVFGRMIEEGRGALANRSFRGLAGGTLLMFMMVGTESALSLYMYGFFWSLGSAEIMYIVMLYPVGLVLGAMFTQRLHTAWDKGPTLLVGIAGYSTCQLLPVFLRLADAMPENGTRALIVILMAFRLVQGAFVQQALVSFASMLADIADQHELDTGRRQEGIFFALTSFAGKASSGAGSFIAGVTLDVIRWPAGAGHEGAAEVSAETIRSLGIVYGPVVAVFAVAAMFSYRLYELNRETHREILAALAARRAAAPPRTG